MPAKNKIKLEQVISLSAHSTRFLNPRRIISQLEIFPGMTVAHFGAGSGYFTFPIAEKVGSTGTVWALDILKNKIELMRSNARALGLGNIIMKRVNLEEVNGSGLEDDSADWVVMVNILYQNIKRSRIIGEAKRVLKKNGRILLIDWKSSPGSLGPVMSTRISSEDLIKSIRKNGLGIAKKLDISESYFGMILTK